MLNVVLSHANIQSTHWNQRESNTPLWDNLWPLEKAGHSSTVLAPVRGLKRLKCKPHKRAPYLLNDFSCLVLLKPRRESKFKGILLLGTKQKQSLPLNSIIIFFVINKNIHMSIICTGFLIMHSICAEQRTILHM